MLRWLVSFGASLWWAVNCLVGTWLEAAFVPAVWSSVCVVVGVRYFVLLRSLCCMVAGVSLVGNLGS